MYAIVEIAGQQFKVAKDQKVYVHRLKQEEGKKVTFDQVLLIGDGDDVTVGAPAIDGAAVEAKIVKHLKGDKVIVFKKKRRKGYRVKNGHRQLLTELVIEGIVAKGAKKTAAKKVTPAKKEAPANILNRFADTLLDGKTRNANSSRESASSLLRSFTRPCSPPRVPVSSGSRRRTRCRAGRTRGQRQRTCGGCA